MRERREKEGREFEGGRERRRERRRERTVVTLEVPSISALDGPGDVVEDLGKERERRRRRRRRTRGEKRVPISARIEQWKDETS